MDNVVSAATKVESIMYYLNYIFVTITLMDLCEVDQHHLT